MTQTPRDVVEETIGQASTFFVAQAKDGYGLILDPSDLKKLIGNLDAIVSREQKLKEAAEKVSEIYESEYTDEEAVNSINDMFIDLLSTLYPDTPKGVGQDGRTLDTPAPKEGTPDDEPI